MADWTDKLVIHSFKGINIELVNGEWKKKPNGIRPEWTKLTESSINKKDRGLAVLTGSKSGILVLDFDDKNIYDDFTMRHPTIKNAPRVVTRKGFHIYFIWKDIYTELPSKIGKLDIQGNGKQVFYVGTEYKTETGDPFTYSWDYYQDLIDLPNELYQELKRSKNPVKKNTEQNVLKIECSRHAALTVYGL